MAIVSGCINDTNTGGPVRPIVGLESGGGLTFTSSPDGSAMSVLYDTATITIPSTAAPIPAGSKSQSRNFRILLGQAPQTLRFQIRGFRAAANLDAVELNFKVGDESIDLSPKLTGEVFNACFEAMANKPTLDVSWTGTVRQVSGEDGKLEIDSIDISALRPDSPKDATCDRNADG